MNMRGYFLLASFSLPGGIIAGGILFFATKIIPPTLLSHLFVGGSVGLLYLAVLWKSHVHSRIATLFFALLTVIVVYSTYHYAYYLDFLSEVAAVMKQASPVSLDDATASRYVQEFLRDTTGQSGFAGYFAFMLENGIQIVDWPIERNPPRTRTGGRLIFDWIFEAILMLIFILPFAYLAPKRPYCQTCKRYYGSCVLLGRLYGGEHVGVVTTPNRDHFLDHLEADRFPEALRLMKSIRSDTPGLSLRIDRCPTCDTNGIALKVYLKPERKNERVKLIFQRLLAPHELEYFKQRWVELRGQKIKAS